jgi:DNA-directed RNA polymerase specialized sigma24 family protein
MDRDQPYDDRIMGKRQLGRYRALVRTPEDEIIEEEERLQFRITGREKEFRALAKTPEQLAQINAWLEEQVSWEFLYNELQKKVWEDERQRKRIKCKQIQKRYYGKLPPEQYVVYLLREGCEMAYEEIAEITRSSQEALRKAYHDATKNVERIDMEAALKERKGR